MFLTYCIQFYNIPKFRDQIVDICYKNEKCVCDYYYVRKILLRVLLRNYFIHLLFIYIFSYVHLEHSSSRESVCLRLWWLGVVPWMTTSVMFAYTGRLRPSVVHTPVWTLVTYVNTISSNPLETVKTLIGLVVFVTKINYIKTKHVHRYLQIHYQNTNR